MSSSITYAKSLVLNFMGNAPAWYKNLVLFFLILNPIVAHYSLYVAGWLLVAEFILTLAMALESYPLEAGGLIVAEACFLGMCDMEAVTHEIGGNLEVLLLLMFMVAGIHFVRDFLLFLFTKIMVHVRSHLMLAFIFCFMSGLISAFVDALTVLAIIISTCAGLYQLYISTISDNKLALVSVKDSVIPNEHLKDLEEFRAFLRSLLMHAAVGTTIGGICTIVGEPQNLIVGNVCGWNFIDFAIRMSPISVPIVLFGLATCFFIEKFKLFGYGHGMPEAVYKILVMQDEKNYSHMSRRDKLNLIVQCLCCIWLVSALALHLASVGVIGLSVIVFATTFCGVSEGEIGQAFTESMPFCALLCVFFTVVAVISAQGLFDPIVAWVFSTDQEYHLPIFYLANGIISAVSDNVFVATIYIQQVRDALFSGMITPEHFDNLAVAINAGTNLPSVATPNGQSAFLFLLTSPLAPLIRLPYFKMMWMALPYTIVLTIVGLIATWYVMPEVTNWFIQEGIVEVAKLENIAKP